MEKKSNTGLVVVIVILVMLIIFGGILFYLNNKGYLSFSNSDKNISDNIEEKDDTKDTTDDKKEDNIHKNLSSISDSELREKYSNFVKNIYQAEIYYIGDISNDNILDLIVLVGTCEADYRYLFFTYDETYKSNYNGGIIMIDALSGWNSSIYYDNGTIIDFSAHMDIYTSLEYKIENNRLILINNTTGEKKPEDDYPTPSTDKQLKFEKIS